MTLILPGVQARRPTWASGLIFHWRAGDGNLRRARTGQPLTFASALAAGPVVGGNGVSLSGGVAMPRLTQEFDATTRLRLEWATRQERVEVPFDLLVEPLSVYLKFRSRYALGGAGTPGGNVILRIGGTATGGGYFVLTRTDTATYIVIRQSEAGSVSRATAVETGAWVPTYEIAASITAAALLRLQLRDGSGVMRADATSSGSAALMNPLAWSDPLLTLGPNVARGDIGGDFDFEEVKVARGALALDQLTALG